MSLPKDWIYQAELLSSSQRRPVISGAFKKVFGRSLDCQFVTTGTSKSTAPAESKKADETAPAQSNKSDKTAPAQETGSEPSSRPLVSEAVKKLKGRVVAQDRGNARRRKGE